MVSAQDSESRGPGSSPGRVICVVFFGKTLYSHSASPPRSINIWVPAKLSGKPDEMLGGYLRWTTIPSERSSNTPSHLMLWKPG